jgi:hypothetical protein
MLSVLYSVVKFSVIVLAVIVLRDVMLSIAYVGFLLCCV